MSTSPRPAPVSAAPRSRPEPAAPQREVQPFPYREVTAAAEGLFAGGQADPAEQLAQREARARESGRMQGEAEARAKFEQRLAEERSVLAAALAEFARERAVYYQKLEAEAVKLALAIARKILHREAQIDPLLLAAIARVAIEKIEGASGVALMVHPQNAPDWCRYFAVHMEPQAVPELVEDPSVPVDRCRLRTSMGIAELGMEVQLKEIEQGLTDLLAARPDAEPGGRP